MTPRSTSRVDLHCHCTASAVSKLGVQRALGLPECATPPREVYELAKRRGMDVVTLAVSWERSLQRLADGYLRALEPATILHASRAA